jgi:GNAT superfamily N-acetyltransferase
MVELVPMTEEEFQRYLETAVASYAEAHLKSGDCDADEALTLAQADYASLLPLGLATPDHHLFSIHAEGRGRIGLVWFAMRERRGRKSAFIYDLLVDDAHRGKGYGAQTLQAVERAAAAMGAARISLNVMGWNHAARSLYEKQGFSVTGMGMTKLIAPVT